MKLKFTKRFPTIELMESLGELASDRAHVMIPCNIETAVAHAHMTSHEILRAVFKYNEIHIAKLKPMLDFHNSTLEVIDGPELDIEEFTIAAKRVMIEGVLYIPEINNEPQLAL